MLKMKIQFLIGALLICFTLSSQDIVKENLGPNINTSFADTKPVISPDGNALFFARQFYPANINGEKDAQDIYFSQKIDKHCVFFFKINKLKTNSVLYGFVWQHLYFLLRPHSLSSLCLKSRRKMKSGVSKHL